MSKEVIPFYIPAVYKSSTYSTSSPIVGIFISFKFYFSQSSGYVVVFIWNSLMTNDVEFFLSCSYWPFTHLVLWCIHSNILCNFKLGCSFFIIELLEFFIYLAYQSFVRYVLCKIFSQYTVCLWFSWQCFGWADI